VTRSLALYFTDFFKVDPDLLREHGAFNVSLLSDIPLFVDPFLLFNSSRTEYQELHANILRYMAFLRDKASGEMPRDAVLKSWFVFKEVKQTWLGFSRIGNRGSGLGLKFARSLVTNMDIFFETSVARDKHLEKLCLIEDGVGRDNISDFTTNLIKEYLLRFTEDFAVKHISTQLRRTVPIERARFNYDTESWQTIDVVLPYTRGDYVILTPVDILTKDETWISRSDLIDEFANIVSAMPGDELRAQLNNYLTKALPKKTRGKDPTKKEYRDAVVATIRAFPTVLDYYVRQKEDDGDNAELASAQKVADAEAHFVQHVLRIVTALQQNTTFYADGDSAEKRLATLLAVTKQRGGASLLRDPSGSAYRREVVLELVLKLIWQAVAIDSNSAIPPFPIQCKLAQNAKFPAAIENRDGRFIATIVVAYSQSDSKEAKRSLEKIGRGNDATVVVVDAW
jgi:hypothetical protein